MTPMGRSNMRQVLGLGVENAPIVSLSVAQYRMLGRLIRGEHLYCSNYRPEHATIAALDRKGYIDWANDDAPGGTRWMVTDLGRKVYAVQGSLRRWNVKMNPPPPRDPYTSAADDYVYDMRAPR